MPKTTKTTPAERHAAKLAKLVAARDAAENAWIRALNSCTSNPLYRTDAQDRRIAKASARHDKALAALHAFAARG